MNKDYLPKEEILALKPDEVVEIPSGMGGSFDVFVTVLDNGELRFKGARKKDPDGWNNLIKNIRMTADQAVGEIFRRVSGKCRSICDVKGHDKIVPDFRLRNICMRCEKSMS